MKKLLLLCSFLIGCGVTGLRAEDATVTLPAPAIPAAPAAAAATPAAQGSAPTPTAGKKHHKKHHKKKATQATTPAPEPKP